MKLESKVKIWVALFTLLSAIPKDLPKGKRARKNTLKALKKAIRISQSEIKLSEFKNLLEKVDTELSNTHSWMKETFGEDANYVNPGALFGLARFKYSEIFLDTDIKNNWIDELVEIHKEENEAIEGRNWQSVKYFNKLVENLI